MAAIFRYEVPVDDAWHTLTLSGPVLHVAARTPETVEVWALSTDGPTTERRMRVFGTGQPLPDQPLDHIGTAFAAEGRLVWHVMEAR